MEIPELDAFIPAMGVFYAVCLGVSALVLTDRKWAWRVVSVFVALLLAVGVLYYHPVAAEARGTGFVDWLEGSVCMGLLSGAGSICVPDMLGVDFTSRRKSLI
jgi:hypothetical protein